MREAWSLFRNGHRDSVSEATLRDYERVYERHIGPLLGELKLRELTAERLGVFERELRRGGIGPSACATVMRVLEAVRRGA
ncbi:MAG: hypothetical protein LLG24_06805 [Actinomycetia bacterium]|nr:hypothetical protein [Actinomycetes bacterium]